MEREWDSRLDALGVRVKSPPDSQVRLVKARWVDPGEAGDKFYIFVRVQDEQGKPLQGQEFRVEFQADTLERRVDRTKGPGLDDFYGNFPMAIGLVHTVDIPGVTSDRVTGLKRGAPGNPEANTCFYLVFQRGAQVVWPHFPPDEPHSEPGQPSTVDEATRQKLLALLDKAQVEIDAARKLLEGKK